MPNLFSANTEVNSPQKVIGLLLSRTKIQALLLGIDQQQLQLLSQSQTVNYTDEKNCLPQVDESLQQLGPESESVEAVVFGLDHDWVNGGDIVAEFKPLLSMLTEKLALKPVGFIDTSEALVQHYLSQNSLLSGVFVILSTSSLTVSYVSQGKIRGTEQVGRSQDIIADLREGLARFSAQVADKQFYLPAKLIIASFDETESELEELRQKLLEFNWTESARFLQTPTIETLTDEKYTAVMAHEAARAAAIATGNYAAAAATAGTSVDEIDEQEIEENSEAFGFSSVSSEPSSEEEQQELDSEPATAAPEVGTAAAGDEGAGAEYAAADQNLEEVSSQTATSFGIPISSDKLVNSSKTPEEIEEEIAAKTPAGLSEVPTSLMGKIKAAWRQPYKGNRSLRFFMLTGFVSGLLVIALIGMFVLSLTAQANVVLFLESEPVSKEISLTLDSRRSSSDPENLILAAQKVEKQISGESTLPTTGVSIVGDKAKGKVNIFNKTTSRKTFDAGTKLSSGDYVFTLDKEVTVASSSVKEVSGGEEKEYGKAEVEVTAEDIGAEHNLDKDTKLTVANFGRDTYEASVGSSGLSGGASREVRVVSETDRTDQLKALREELIKKANEEYKSEAKDGLYTFPVSEIIDESASFSAEEGKEANDLSLKLSLTVSALTYRSEDLQPIAEVVLASQIPEGYKLSEETINVMSSPAEADELGTASGNSLILQISSFVQPILDVQLLAEDIAKKPLGEALSLLNANTQINKAEITISPMPASWIRKRLPGAEKIFISFDHEES